jgi:hypothetical protein
MTVPLNFQNKKLTMKIDLNKFQDEDNTPLLTPLKTCFKKQTIYKSTLQSIAHMEMKIKKIKSSIKYNLLAKNFNVFIPCFFSNLHTQKK